MKHRKKLNQLINLKFVVKSIFAILFSLAYLGYMHVGTQVCGIDEIYCIYFCVGMLFYIICKYCYNYIIYNIFTIVKKDGENL